MELRGFNSSVCIGRKYIADILFFKNLSGLALCMPSGTDRLQVLILFSMTNYKILVEVWHADKPKKITNKYLYKK